MTSIQQGKQSPAVSLSGLDGASWQLSSKPTLLVFFETDCPTCRLTIPYLNRLSQRISDGAEVVGISQDGIAPTRELVESLPIDFRVVIDDKLIASRSFEPVAVPALFLIDSKLRIVETEIGFDKNELNALTSKLCELTGHTPFTIAEPYDGNPSWKPGCASRHLEPITDGEPAVTSNAYGTKGNRASRIELEDFVDPYEYCRKFDPLPVIPPTVERVEQMLAATDHSPDELIALIPPNYGAATVEKIAANAVMAGCSPEIMPVLISLIRCACDERFNLHGVQATTHFAAPLIIINGPIRLRLGFASRSNVFSNVARANSTLGRAFQLLLTNIGGGKPGEIDMSTLGNPGKFSYCIAENEEANPWDPLHVEKGFEPDQSTVTLFAAEPPRGVSEHNARDARGVLTAITRSLVTSWSYRVCAGIEALVILCPEHVRTIYAGSLSKEDVRRYLYENTGVPKRYFEDLPGEGVAIRKMYAEATIDGEPCYRKFSDPSAIKIVVAGGDAGKFSAVISSWAAGPRGSQMITYPISD
jgi:peroxiredoxin